MYAISPLCVSSVDQRKWIFSFPERFEGFFFSNAFWYFTLKFRIITGRCFQWNGNTRWIWDFYSLTFWSKCLFSQCTEKHRKTTVSHFYLLDVFFSNCLVLPCFECCFWMLIRPGTRLYPGANCQTWGFNPALVKFFFNGVSDYSIIHNNHNIKIHIRFKHRCLMSKPCLSTIYDLFLYNMILTD